MVRPFPQIFKCSFLLLVLTSQALCGHAQTVPDAGLLRQQIEQGNKALQPTPRLPEKAAPPRLKKLVGTTLIVKEFKISGNTRLSTEALQAVVTPFLNRPLDFSQLQDAAEAVGNAYRKAGWIVHAYLPQQEIEGGVVRIVVVEATFGGARFEGPSSARMSSATIQKYVAAAQKVGEPVYVPAVDRALLLLGDIPGIAVTGNLREGTSSGQTDLVFNVQDKSLLSGDAALDNTGSRSTGSLRLSGNLNLNSPLALGDQFSTNLTFSEGSAYVRQAVSLPLGQDGLRAGVNASYMTYRVIAPELKSLNSLGASATAGVDASYPLIRSRPVNLYFAVNYDHKYFNNEANSSVTTRYFIDVASGGLSGNLADSVLGGGWNNFSLGWVHGLVDLDKSPNQVADSASTNTQGAFDKIRYAANRLQSVTKSLDAYGALSGQKAGKNLDSSEKFYLGGANGVRAYPSSEGGGSDGLLVNLELRAHFPNRIDLTGFYDLGRVSVNRNNNYTGAPTLNTFYLQGFGITTAWANNSGFSVKATWARRIGNNPNPTATGNDQDGSLQRDRIWLQATMQL